MGRPKDPHSKRAYLELVCAHDWDIWRTARCGCRYRDCYGCGATEWDATDCTNIPKPHKSSYNPSEEEW
jgi:hypothetical protein